MKEKQAHVMSLLSLPDPSLHYSLELKYAYIHSYTHTYMYTHTHTHTHTQYLHELMHCLLPEWLDLINN